MNHDKVTSRQNLAKPKIITNFVVEFLAHAPTIETFRALVRSNHHQ